MSKGLYICSFYESSVFPSVCHSWLKEQDAELSPQLEKQLRDDYSNSCYSPSLQFIFCVTFFIYFQGKPDWVLFTQKISSMTSKLLNHNYKLMLNEFIDLKMF